VGEGEEIAPPSLFNIDKIVTLCYRILGSKHTF